MPNGLRNLPDVAQYGARANPCAAGAITKKLPQFVFLTVKTAFM